MIGPHDVLQHMEVEPGLYVVGSFERRVTLYSQQVRALNLVYALSEQAQLPKGSAVAVIGGGAAGLTVAAGVARLGCHVTLLEQADVLMSTIRGNHTRWIHPHLYDWPAAESEREDAGLPLLDWKAATAHGVVEQIEQAWQALPERGSITVHYNVKSINPRARRVSWNAEGFHDEIFDSVIVAVGFGQERKMDKVQWVSYWRDDALHQRPQKGSARYLISGCGDGGLIDLLRVRLRDFNHDDIAALLAVVPDNVKAELLAIDEDVHRSGDSARWMFQQYNKLQLPVLDAAIKARLRSDTTAVLNARDDVPFTRNASIVNRLLMSRLLRLGDVPYRSGELVCAAAVDGYEVQFSTGAPERFDSVIVRHGPSPSALEANFPEIWRNSAKIRERNVLDQTRWPIYGDAFGPAPVAKPAPALTPAPTASPRALAATSAAVPANPAATPLTSATPEQRPLPHQALRPPWPAPPASTLRCRTPSLLSLLMALRRRQWQACLPPSRPPAVPRRQPLHLPWPPTLRQRPLLSWPAPRLRLRPSRHPRTHDSNPRRSSIESSGASVAGLANR